MERERARDELGIKKDIFLLGFEWGSFAIPVYDTVRLSYWCSYEIGMNMAV